MSALDSRLNYATDGTPIHVLLPAPPASDGSYLSPYGNGLTLETLNSSPFTFPRGGIGVVTHVPAMTGTAATIKLQSLASQFSDQETQAWRDVLVYNLSDGTMRGITGLVEDTCVTLPLAAIGGGVFRWVASESQAAAPITIRMNVLITR